MDQRSLRRKKKDRYLLRCYAWVEYERMRRVKATQHGVPLGEVRTQDGKHKRTINRGFAELCNWWDSLSESLRTELRSQLQREIKRGPRPNEEDFRRAEHRLAKQAAQ